MTNEQSKYPGAYTDTEHDAALGRILGDVNEQHNNAQSDPTVMVSYVVIAIVALVVGLGLGWMLWG